MTKKGKIICLCVSAAATILIVVFAIKIVSGLDSYRENKNVEEIEEAKLLYGIEYENYSLDEGVVLGGQSMSTILNKYGVGMATIDRIVHSSEGIFNFKNIRAGKPYIAFLEAETDSTCRLAHFVYEQNITSYLVISIEGDSVGVRMEHKEVRAERKVRSATIESSLWNSMIANDMSPALAMELSDIFAWTIDFFGLQSGDHFTVIYDERYVDTTSIGTGRIWGVHFNHMKKDYYAIPFMQGDKIAYWDETGNSLKKSMLKAPLTYSRISSKFSNSRLHPVLKIRRPHHGVDYAAPSGTPVVAVADGVVTMRAYSGGGGNTIKIKHAHNLVTGYLHLRGYARGLAVGKRVRQGDVIGYVGSTGLSTGPHLDYRVWKKGTPIDPLKVTSLPVEPIPAKSKKEFEFVRDRIISELRVELADSLRITQLDSIVITKTQPNAERPAADSLVRP